MADLEIRGADKLGKLAKALKQAGDKDLQKELYAGLNRATKPLRSDAKRSADENLPRRGGLNKRVARARMSTRRRGGKNPGIKIVAKGMPQLGRIDRLGKVKHPVHGHRDRWVDQKIPEAQGWFTDPMQAGAPPVRKELVRTLDAIARKLARKY
jgi:hypothetical protein